jgi:hypothetical protein
MAQRCSEDGPTPDVIADLQARFRRARSAALAGTLDERYDPALGERALLARVSLPENAGLLRRAFDLALQLGRGFVRFHGVGPTRPAAFEGILTETASPCLRGDWRCEAGGEVAWLSRPACSDLTGTLPCRFSREAIDGLVLGLSGGRVRHARLASPVGGESTCVDVLHVEARREAPFAPIPEALRAGVEAALASVRGLAGPGGVRLLGMQEGALHYERTGVGQLAVGDMLARAFKRRLPALRIVDLTPRAVLEGGPPGGT